MVLMKFRNDKKGSLGMLQIVFQGDANNTTLIRNFLTRIPYNRVCVTLSINA